MNFSNKLNNGIITTLLGILIFSVSLFAQPDQRQHRPPMLPDSTQIVKMVDNLSSALSLSKDQKEKITNLHFSHFKEAGELMAKDKADHEINRSKLDELREIFEEQVKSLLNDDQKMEFEKFMMRREKEPREPRR